LKLDWNGGGLLDAQPNLQERKEKFTLFNNCLRQQPRGTSYTVCQRQ